MNVNPAHPASGYYDTQSISGSNTGRNIIESTITHFIQEDLKRSLTDEGKFSVLQAISRQLEGAKLDPLDELTKWARASPNDRLGLLQFLPRLFQGSDRAITSQEIAETTTKVKNKIGNCLTINSDRSYTFPEDYVLRELLEQENPMLTLLACAQQNAKPGIDPSRLHPHELFFNWLPEHWKISMRKDIGVQINGFVQFGPGSSYDIQEFEALQNLLNGKYSMGELLAFAKTFKDVNPNNAGPVELFCDWLNKLGQHFGQLNTGHIQTGQNSTSVNSSSR